VSDAFVDDGSITTTVVNVLCGLFAVVHVAHVVVVMDEANSANEVASFVRV